MNYGYPVKIKYIILTCLIAFISFANAADSYRVNSGATTQITEFGVCANVTNNHSSGSGILVPTKTENEWTTFRTRVPAGVTANSCRGWKAHSMTWGSSCPTNNSACPGGGDTDITNYPPLDGPCNIAATIICGYDDPEVTNCLRVNCPNP